MFACAFLWLGGMFDWVLLKVMYVLSANIVGVSPGHMPESSFGVVVGIALQVKPETRSAVTWVSLRAVARAS